MRIVMFVVAFLALQATAAGAGSDTYVVDPGLVTATIPGPVTVIVTANPFRTPWTVIVNGQALSGPSSIPFPALPQPTVSATTDVPVNGRILVAILPPPQAAPATVRCSDLTALARLTACTAELEGRVSVLIGAVPSDDGRSVGVVYRTIRDAQREFVALQDRTDMVVAAQTANLSSEKTRPASVRAFGCLIVSEPETARDCDKDGAALNRVTVASVNSAIARVQPYPAQDLAAAKSDLDQLRGAARSRPVTAAGRTALGRLTARLDAIDAELRPYLADGTYAKFYDAAVAQLQTVSTTMLSNVSVGRFFAVVSERCPGFVGEARSTFVTVMRSANITNSVTIRCPARTLFGPRR